MISGLPPRFKDDIIRTKVKDFNDAMNKWADQNEIKFIDNEAPFELRNGDIDKSVYITTGEHPGVHLSRDGTTRMLKKIQKYVPELTLSDLTNARNKPSYASVVSQGFNSQKRTQQPNEGYRMFKQNRGCFNCSESNHVQSQCKYGQKIRCLKCHKLGHKRKFCRE